MTKPTKEGIEEAAEDYENLLHHASGDLLRAYNSKIDFIEGANWMAEWFTDNVLCPELDRQAALSYALGKSKQTDDQRDKLKKVRELLMPVFRSVFESNGRGSDNYLAIRESIKLLDEMLNEGEKE